MFIGVLAVFVTELIILILALSRKYVRFDEAAYGALGFISVTVTLKYRFSEMYEALSAGHGVADKSHAILILCALLCIITAAAMPILRIVFGSIHLKKQNKSRVPQLFEVISFVLLSQAGFMICRRIIDYEENSLYETVLGSTLCEFFIIVGLLSAAICALLACIQRRNEAKADLQAAISDVLSSAGRALLFTGIFLLCIQLNNNLSYRKVSDVTFVDDGSGSVIVMEGDFSQYFYMDREMLDYFQLDENGNYYYYKRIVNGEEQMAKPRFVNAETVYLTCILTGIILIAVGLFLRRRKNAANAPNVLTAAASLDKQPVMLNNTGQAFAVMNESVKKQESTDT